MVTFLVVFFGVILFFAILFIEIIRLDGKAVKEGAPKAEAEEIKAKLEAAGAEVELK